jgi:hypothetical protein
MLGFRDGTKNSYQGGSKHEDNDSAPRASQ